MKLVRVEESQIDTAMKYIEDARKFLKAQGVDQWQSEYPSKTDIAKDIHNQTAFFLEEDGMYYGYLCADLNGEPAYEHLQGNWSENAPYIVCHRMALDENSRGKGLASGAFQLVEQYGKENGVHWFRVDTDEDNALMKHLLDKNGFAYVGKIWFDYSEKIAYEKKIG